MNQKFVIAIGITIASLSFSTAIAQEHHEERDTKPQHKPPVKKPTAKPKPGHGQPNRPPQNRPPTRPPTRPSNQGNWLRPQPHPNQRPIYDGYNYPRIHQPRPGQIVIPRNRYWYPNQNYQFSRPQYSNLNYWQSSTFIYSGQTRRWNPAAWRYAIDDSLMEIIFRSERISNSMRASFESQASRSDIRSSLDGAKAWNRIQRLDQGLEKLRYETGNVDERDLSSAVLDVLSLGRVLATTINRDNNVRRMVSGDWNDLQYELNELARYYGESIIQ